MTALPVYIVGYGNVGWALHQLFTQQGFTVKVVSESHQNNDTFISRTTFYEEKLPVSSLVFITVTDSKIREVSEKIKAQDIHIIHCSGATALDKLSGNSRGVWYPLNTFTKGILPDWSKTLIGIESNNSQLQTLLTRLAQTLGLKSMILSSEQRLKVHLAAVFASNFSMASVMIAQQLLKEHGMPENALNELVMNGMNKLSTMSAFEALTGPAKRNDLSTINKHRELLAEKPELKKLYEDFTALIQQHRP